MTRISTYAAHNTLVARLIDTQQLLHKLQVQVASEKKSPNYAGIARDASKIINLENERDIAQRFIDNNTLADLKLQAMDNSISAITKTVKDFRSLLTSFRGGDMKDEAEVASIQKFAFRALQDMASYLGVSVDGQYLFAGAKVEQEPVRLGFSSLDDFQAHYDGHVVTYPTTRVANLAVGTTDPAVTGDLTVDGSAANGSATITAANAGTLAGYPPGSTITLSGTTGSDGTWTVLSNDGDTITVKTSRFADEVVPGNSGVLLTAGSTVISGATTGALTFSEAGDMVTAANAGSLADFPVGTAFTVSGTASNDGTYTVAANDGTNLTIVPRKFGAAETVTATISAETYYYGDTMALEHRVDADRQIQIGVNAVDPAFEKAMRAMALIAQGVFGTAGGLDQNTERAAQALWLLNDAVDSPTPGTPPFGAEKPSDLQSVAVELGSNRFIIKTKNEKHAEFMAFFEKNIQRMENADPTETLVRLLDQQRALEVSYQTIGRVGQLSLADYLK